MAAIVLGRVLYPAQYQDALNRRVQWQRTLKEIFKKVDFIALPTLQGLPPPIPRVGKIALLEARMLILQNTVAVNLAGNPALAMPVPITDKKVPVTSLQLIGPRLSEAKLLNVGRLIESRQPERIRQIAPSNSAQP
jgi:amidase